MSTPFNGGLRRPTHERQGWRPATGADFWRLAEEADERGSEIFRYGRVDETGEPVFDRALYIALSASHYDVGYLVDVVSGCSCPGYARQLRCVHYAALLKKLGMLPDPDEPGPAGPAAAAGRPGTGHLGSDEAVAPASGAGLALGALAIETGRLEAEYEALRELATRVTDTQGGGFGEHWQRVDAVAAEMRQLREIAAAPDADKLFRFAWEVAPIWWGLTGDPVGARRRAGRAAAAATEEQRQVAIGQFLAKWPREWLRFVELWASFLPEEITKPRRGGGEAVAENACDDCGADPWQLPAAAGAAAKAKRTRKVKAAAA